jgi:transcription elongation factor Elf1
MDIPVIDCRKCGHKNVALIAIGPYAEQKARIRNWICPICKEEYPWDITKDATLIDDKYLMRRR